MWDRHWNTTPLFGIHILWRTSARWKVSSGGLQKKLNGLHDLTYEQRLQVLNLDSLEVRRIRADLVLTFKIIRGISRVKISDFFTVSTATKTRGHCYKLSMPKVRTDIRKYFFSSRIVKVWNALPTDKVNFNSLNGFIRSLSAVALDKHCRSTT